MAIFPTVEFKNDFRMAEFAKWGYAIAEALGNGMGEEFLAAYRSNIARQATEAITCHTLLNAVTIFMEEMNREQWTGRPSDFLREVKRIGYEYGLNMRSSTMPQSAAALTKMLNAHKSVLQKAGIEYTHNGHFNDGSRITLRITEE